MPTTIAGLTLELLRSVNGIGSRTTSSREQNIVNVVSFVVPDTRQRALALIQPLPALGVVMSGLKRDLDHRVFGQLQRLKRPEFTPLVDGSNGDCHARTTPAIRFQSIPFSTAPLLSHNTPSPISSYRDTAPTSSSTAASGTDMSFVPHSAGAAYWWTAHHGNRPIMT